MALVQLVKLVVQHWLQQWYNWLCSIEALVQLVRGSQADKKQSVQGQLFGCNGNPLSINDYQDDDDDDNSHDDDVNDTDDGDGDNQ